MVKNYLFLFLICLGSIFGMKAQITTEPSPLTVDSDNVVIYFHADEGNKGLMNLPESTTVYAHTGVITNTSTSDKDWQYAPKWLDNSAKYKLTYVSKNLYRLNIGNMRNYYGITNPTVEIKKLAFVFRTADGSKEGKGTGNSDIFVNVLSRNFELDFTPSFTTGIVTASTGEVTFTASASKQCDISISVNGKEINKGSNVYTLETGYTFTTPGKYVVTAKGVNSGVSIEKEIIVNYLNPATEAVYPGGIPMPGATLQDDGSVLFCLPAPEKEVVTVLGSWNNFSVDEAVSMNYQIYEGQKYFWTKQDVDGKKEFMYYYNVDGKYSVGDPYARLILDPDNDKYIPSDVFPGLPAYPRDYVKGNVPLALVRPSEADSYHDWVVKDFKPADKDNLVIYELLLRDFTGTEGEAKGNGTVNQVYKHMPYLINLGVNAVELLPINEFNGNISWGYNPNFYFAPDKAYGTPEDYKRLIDAFHDHGIAVILDVVLNQSDWMHPWYQMYETGKNPMYNASAPHAYSVLNDWNQDHPLVQRQWKDMLTYWLKVYNVDGFRFDLVKGLGDNDSYANSGDAATNAYNASRVARMRELQKIVNEVKPGAIFINENLATPKEENEMAETGQLNWANFNNAGCQFAMGYQDGSGLEGMYAPDNSRTWGSTVSYLESHDEQRLAYKQKQWGQMQIKGNPEKSMQRLGSAAAQMLLTPGSHMIWQFSELGNDQNTKNSDGGNNTDPKIVCWSLLDNPHNAALEFSYRQLINLRLNNPELFAKDAYYKGNCTVSDWAQGRMMVSASDKKKLITVVNPNLEGEISVKLDFSGFDASSFFITSKSQGSEPKLDIATATLTVPANCYAVVATQGIVGVEKIVDDDADRELIVTVADGGIRFISVADSVDVFSVDGGLVYSGSMDCGELLPLNQGIYIVKSGKETVKVMCR